MKHCNLSTGVSYAWEILKFLKLYPDLTGQYLTESITMAVGPYFGFLLHHVCTFEEEGHVNHKIPRQKNKSSSMEWMTHNNGRSEGRAELCWAT